MFEQFGQKLNKWMDGQMNRHFWDSGSNEVENSHSSSWSSVRAGFSQSSVLGPPFFLIIQTIYQKTWNHLLNYLQMTTCSLLFVIHKIFEWTFKWKMLFNSDVPKQAEEVIFQVKLWKLIIQLPFLSSSCTQ